MDLSASLRQMANDYATLLTPSGLADMWSRPFGLLAPVHEAALRGVDLAQPQRLAEYFLLPAFAVWVQAFLLVQEGERGSKRQEGSNRLLRLAAGVVALMLMARSYFSYRFTGESRVCAECRGWANGASWHAGEEASTQRCVTLDVAPRINPVLCAWCTGVPGVERCTRLHSPSPNPYRRAPSVRVTHPS